MRRLPHQEPLARDEHSWLDVSDGVTRCAALAMPVQRVPGHSRLVVTAFFHTLDDDGRAEAERVYLARRPFAVGYFRLWQVDRARMRRLAALETALNRAEFGIVLLDREGRVVFANTSAEATLDEADGLRRHRGGVAAAGLQDNVKLRAAIEHVAGLGGSRPKAPLLMVQRAGRSALVVSVMPTDERPTEATDTAVILYVLDPSLDTERLLQPVCKLYHLTPVETKLACRLTNGATLAEAAAAMKIKEQTAKGCLRQIFAKTDTNRQADLIRTLLSNLVRTARAIPFEVIP